MDNKKLGIALIIFCIFIGVIFFSFKSQLRENSEESCTCDEMLQGDVCPADAHNHLHVIDYITLAVIFSMFTLGIYLVFFEKSQKEIIRTLENQKKIQTDDEKFGILTTAMDEHEKKVLSAIREQDGITQSTLRYRTDLSKSKLSSILSDFEKKGLIKRVQKGKTLSVHLK